MIYGSKDGSQAFFRTSYEVCNMKMKTQDWRPLLHLLKFSSASGTPKDNAMSVWNMIQVYSLDMLIRKKNNFHGIFILQYIGGSIRKLFGTRTALKPCFLTKICKTQSKLKGMHKYSNIYAWRGLHLWGANLFGHIMFGSCLEKFLYTGRILCRAFRNTFDNQVALYGTPAQNYIYSKTCASEQIGIRLTTIFLTIIITFPPCPTFWNAFSRMKMYEFCLRSHWNLFLIFELKIIQHQFRQWLGADRVTSHYLYQLWLKYRHIYASLGLSELGAWVTCKIVEF